MKRKYYKCIKIETVQEGKEGFNKFNLIFQRDDSMMRDLDQFVLRTKGV